MPCIEPVSSYEPTQVDMIVAFVVVVILHLSAQDGL